jgi:hypothetical protein
MHTELRLGKYAVLSILGFFLGCASKEVPRSPPKPGPVVYFHRSNFILMTYPVRIFINDKYQMEIYGLKCESFQLNEGLNSVFLQAANSSQMEVTSLSNDEIYLVDIDALDSSGVIAGLEIKTTLLRSPKTLPASCANE